MRFSSGGSILDIAGRIPTVEETQEFIRSNDPQKRAKLIDKLLGSDGYTSTMFNYWADVLRLTDNVKGRITAEAYEEWLKKQLKANVPYDEMVRNLLTTDGGVWDSGAIGFYMRDENKLDHLAYAVQVFLGTQIVCAQCHNHPFDKWTQMDYYGMAAFTYGMDTKTRNVIGGVGKPQKGGKDFKNSITPEMRAKMAAMSKDERNAAMEKLRKEQQGEMAKVAASRKDLETVKKAMQDVMKPLRYTSITWEDKTLPKLPADYKYPDAKAGETIQPKAMFGHEADISGNPTRLDAFAKWMTSPENPRFTTVIANRMWKKAFGVGLIEPVDEMTDSTVPSNNELMEYLISADEGQAVSPQVLPPCALQHRHLSAHGQHQGSAAGRDLPFHGPHTAPHERRAGLGQHGHPHQGQCGRQRRIRQRAAEPVPR